MLSLRAAVASSGLGSAAFAHSPVDIYHEQDAIMVSYTAHSLLSMAVAMLAVAALLSARPGFVAAVAACLLSCCVHMFGWMALTRTPLNALSLIPLLLSAGLCIDYCTHVAHAFWAARGTSSERALAALRRRGAAVANGGCSTGLSQIFLAFGKSLVFTTFFKMMVGVVLVGLCHALLVLPCCLSLLPGFDSEEGEKDGRGAEDGAPSPGGEEEPEEPEETNAAQSNADNAPPEPARSEPLSGGAGGGAVIGRRAWPEAGADAGALWSAGPAGPQE
mmetsp:Transcript_64594/g.183347  ORF Transcript_64594/g.183347 Transcript_64594/m.183347 type:complete len:276 (-) Transcript_64594:14-841(-)